MRAEAILPARTETGGLKPGRWSRSDHHSLDVQSSRYTPPARSDGARTINGLDLPEGYGLMGPAGDERLGERRLLAMGASAPSHAALRQKAEAATRVNQGLNGPDSATWGGEGLRRPMGPLLGAPMAPLASGNAGGHDGAGESWLSRGLGLTRFHGHKRALGC